MRSLLCKGSLGRSWESFVEGSSDNPGERARERELGPGQCVGEGQECQNYLGGELAPDAMYS